MQQVRWTRIKVAGRPVQHDARIDDCVAGVTYDAGKRSYDWTARSMATITMKVPYIEPRHGVAKGLSIAKREAAAALRACAREVSSAAPRRAPPDRP